MAAGEPPRQEAPRKRQASRRPRGTPGRGRGHSTKYLRYQKLSASWATADRPIRGRGPTAGRSACAAPVLSRRGA